jgi:hypothetical protein
MNEPKPQTAAELMAELNADPDFCCDSGNETKRVSVRKPTFASRSSRC